MDILVSSNLERFLYHELGDAEVVKTLMKSLQKDHCFVLPSPVDKNDGRVGDTVFGDRKELYWGYAKEEEVQRIIAETAEQDTMVIDPHTACGVAVYRKYRQEEKKGRDGASYGLILSTASPYKFTETVLSALHEAVPGTLEEQWKALSQISHTPVPDPFLHLMERKARKACRLRLSDASDAVLSFARGV